MTNINNYDQLDFCLNTLHDYINNKSTNTCYIFKPIFRNSLKLSDIKKSSDFDFTHIFNAKFDFINIYNNKWLFTRTSDSSLTCSLSFGFYDDPSKYNNIDCPELVNISMLYLCSEYVLNDNFKHVLLPIMYFDINKNKLLNLFPDFSSHISTNNNNNMYVLITEHYSTMIPLVDYLKKNFSKMTILHWKVLFFQLLYTLAKLNIYFNNFRHNMLNLDSIMLNIRDITNLNNNTETYKVGNITFNIPVVDFNIKICDFYKSTYNNLNNNSYDYNPYYDIHYFFNSLYIFLKSNFNIPYSILIFLNDIVPEKLRIEPDVTFIGLNELTFDKTSSFSLSPPLILNNNIFFTDFLSVTITNSPNIHYTDSLTDTSINHFRLLGKNFPINKKSKQYYRRMPNNSRKIIVSDSNSNSFSENTIFDEIELQYNKHINYDDEILNNKHLKKSKKSSQSRHIPTYISPKNPPPSNNSSSNDENLKKSKKSSQSRHIPKKSSPSNNSSYDENINPDETSVTNNLNSDYDAQLSSLRNNIDSNNNKHEQKLLKKIHKLKKKYKKYKNNVHNVDNSIMTSLDNSFRKKIQQLPNNYTDEVPFQLTQNLPSLDNLNGSHSIPLNNDLGLLPTLNTNILPPSFVGPTNHPSIGSTNYPSVGPTTYPSLGLTNYPSVGPPNYQQPMGPPNYQPMMGSNNYQPMMGGGQTDRKHIKKYILKKKENNNFF